MGIVVDTEDDDATDESERFSQIGLIQAVSNYLINCGFNEKLVPRHYNAIIEGCNIIVDAIRQPATMSSPGSGLHGWLQSDDTGLSSKYMAHVLASGPKCEYAYPSDPSDLGRCLRLLLAVPEIKDISPMAQTGKEWQALISRWDELERLYAEEFPSGTAPKLYERMRGLLDGQCKEAGAPVGA